MTELQARQKSQRLLNKMKTSSGAGKNGSRNKLEQFNLYKQKAKNVSNPNELLPGLNDISDAFEALPLDVIKYFTLLKEIDAKSINNVPQINHSIKKYIDNLHDRLLTQKPSESTRRLAVIKDKILDIIPCLEEKMHVASVATDLLHKHMYRINNDYKLIINNNEIPESIRIGPLNHPAMIMDSQSPSDLHNPNRSAQSQRLESRREALAAKKANKDDPVDDDGNLSANISTAATVTTGGKKKGPKGRDATPAIDKSGSGAANGGNSLGTTKKRSRKEMNQDDISRPNTPSSANISVSNSINGKNGNGNTSNGVGSNNPGSYSSNAAFSNSALSSSASTNGSNGVKKRNTKPKKEDIFVNVEITSSNNAGSGNNNTSSGNSEPTYCYCNQVSFGEMVGCDGDDCKREWFHLPCIGFKNPPKGKWYCDDCVVKMKKSKKI